MDGKVNSSSQSMCNVNYMQVYLHKELCTKCSHHGGTGKECYIHMYDWHTDQATLLWVRYKVTGRKRQCKQTPPGSFGRGGSR